MMEALSRYIYRALMLLTVSSAVTLSGAAQAVPAGTSAPGASKLELFGEYGYFHPVKSDIYNQEYTPLTFGGVAGVSGYFNRTFGLQGEYAKFPNSPDYCFSTVQGGPVFRHQMGRLVPFAHVLGGGAQIGPSYAHNGASNPCSWGWTGTGGLGIDYVLPVWNNHLAIRPVEGDFEYVHVNYGPQPATNVVAGGVGNITAYRLSAGFVIRFGDMSPALPASFGCEAQPVTVYPGDPVTVTGKVINLEENKKLLPAYTWSTSGGRITGGSGGATVATSGMAAGDYNVVGKVSEGGQPNQHAECSASFRVIAYQPPTIACSANPTSVLAGGFSTITAVARSPQNRALTYSFGASAGQITSNGPKGTLATADVNPGAVTVTCNTVDDVGNSASATAVVTITAPPPAPAAPAPVARSLCSVSFDRDKKRPVRVDNEAKGCLDDIALELNRDTGAVLVVVGKHDPQEKPEAAAERTLNIKQYLTDEKGIDANRIEVRTGESTGRTADNVLVPPGATWDTGSTTSFDPSRVPRHGEAYAPAPKK